ncbi:MAG: amidase [Alphaproteobacteria bacterium]|nr:amidase [Alphaproteobacteria bacterium]MBU2040963.1 amidase [Alphaproteobacteria bacterium]MBU2126223.1 amidase [Alphaproteobacteria bacterium]MBU2207403.1 amidase [Alphaproteobacteria bacterium]MBU2291519.1 amidase [Alphaproteobacteria bacterium]
MDGQFPGARALEGSLALIQSVDHIGPEPFNAVITVSPALLGDQPHPSPDGWLRGLPVLLKDNIETADMPTTAGSLALVDNASGRDAPVAARLRAAGAVVLGKTNLSEWANIRSGNSISGWSAVGGQALNPYDPLRTPCGSSSGSATAVALGLAPAAIGTETDGSITCPASVTGVVGFKPTVGLVSRTHIVPISHSQDTAGPIATTVEDAAIVLTAIAGSDPLDPATVEADARRVDYHAALDANSLQGARLGVMRFLISNYSAETQAEFERALVNLRAAGAEIVEITEPPADFRQIGGWELTVLLTELKHDLNLYLASTDPTQVRTRTLADVIAFNAAEPRETVLFGQELFERAEATGGLDDPAYVEARERSFRAAGPEGIDRMMADHGVVALIAPTTSRAWTNDREDDDNPQGSASRLAAVAGYPHLTVPMGFDRGMPVGISFIGGKWDDARILSLGHAYERRTMERRAPALAGGQPSL